MIDPATGHRLWDEFLAAWPPNRLASITLAEYSASGSQDTLTYWLESRTETLGSIWGGSAFKFGIFSRKSEDKKVDGGGLSYNDDYAWYSKYGHTAEAAFKTVRDIVVRVAAAAEKLELETIEKIEFSPAIKWKLAFLYQSRATPMIVPVYKKTNLQSYASAIGLPPDSVQSALYKHIRESASDKDILELGAECWQTSEKLLAGQGFSISAAEEFLKARYNGYRKPPTQKIAAFETESGRQIAVPREGRTVRLILEPPLPTLQGLGEAEIYEPNRGRHSNLGSQAPALATGQPAVQVTIPNVGMLEKLCDLYDGGSGKEGEPLQAQQTGTAVKSALPLNLILYGPPGTGKTHATVAKALEAVDPTFLAANRANRAALTARFRELQDIGRIRFITFHQSFSYEDFVEGIRATKDENGQLIYKVEDGVFKNLCNSAAAKVTKSTSSPVDIAGRTVWKMSLGNTLGDDTDIFEECIQNG
jgi:5-methylcytosine-specific restriction enzyme B